MLIWILLGVAILALFVYLLIDLILYSRGLKFNFVNKDNPEENGMIIIRIATLAAKLFPKHGIALNKVIHFDSNVASAYLVAHEYKHILQQREIGTFKFLFKYIFSKKFRVWAEADADEYGKRMMNHSTFMYVSSYLSRVQVG